LLENDPALLRSFREGDRAALSKVYRIYSPEVARFLTKGFAVQCDSGVATVAVSPLDLDAAHQETFVRAFKSSARMAYDGIRPYSVFLRAIARSAAVDLLRASGKVGRESVPLDDVPELAHKPASARDPEQQALEGELRAVVRRFLDSVSIEDKELARLRFIESLSQEMAASALGLTRSEIRTRERRVKEKFIKHLMRLGWLDEGNFSKQALGMSALSAL